MMKVFRVSVEVAGIDRATEFYAALFDTPGKRHPGARHYFTFGDVIVAVLDVAAGGEKPQPCPALYFAVDDINAVHTRARKLNALATFMVHDEPASDLIERPWGERSFYVTDPWGNELCFVEQGTLYT
jgi:predicted enzyme related to lactoylglutathione lyase